jgi:hypothetical protein
MKFFKRILKIFFWILLACIILTVFFYFKFSPTTNPTWGVNFSPNQAKYLGLNPKNVFSEMLSEIKPKKLRLMAYWEDVEETKGKFNFSEMDLMLFQAEQAGAKVTLVIGHKQPRWPECHEPNWYSKLSSLEKKQTLFEYLKVSVEHFKTFFAIERWQVENEPFFNFGPNCPVLNFNDLKEEVSLVKSLDTRPVVITDSGEKGGWFSAARLSDIFGATMYRTVFHSRFNRYITYPLPPAWYRVRAGMLEVFTSVKKVIGVELQAEPWFEKDFYSASVSEQLKIMDINTLSNNISYAKNTGLPEHFLWGVEWWYFMKQNGHSEFWNKIRSLNN